MTELQQKEFELLKLFVAVCEKYNLSYFLVCGSALGAARYKGFIPWDDDIDVALPRDDYERFLSVAQNELPSWAFLQNYRTDKEYPLLSTKLRDSRTTYIESWCKGMNIHHGVFIDIFPLDGYPQAEDEQRKFEKKKKYYWRRRCSSLPRFIHRDIGLTLCSMGHFFLGMYKDTSKYVKANEAMLKENNVHTSLLWCNFANSMSSKEYAKKEYYGNGITATFEGLTVKIPEKYDEYLTQKYGDWNRELPENEQKGHHYYAVCDLNKPYTEYIKH